MCEFTKMHGAGNDFIIADDRALKWPKNAEFVKNLCDRHRGIGADGMILLSAPSSSQAQLKMSFFNSDGFPAEMCGNGLRCAALFARRNLNLDGKIIFETGAGLLTTKVLNSTEAEIELPVKQRPEKINVGGREAYFVNTGVPHLILVCDDVFSIDVEKQGSELRCHHLFQPEGTNVDYVAVPENPTLPVMIRTYERGVEGETAACGTGIAAAGLILGIFFNMSFPIEFVTRDYDTVSVDLCCGDNMLEKCKKILLRGPAVEVYKGKICPADLN